MRRPLLWVITRLYWISISFLYKTSRINTIGEKSILERMSQGEKFLFCFFHGDYLLLFPRFGNRDVCIFTTKSKRGTILAEIIRLFGYRPCMIPDKRGSRLALEQMTREIQRGYHAVIVVDGPLGPYRRVKHGVVVLAKRTGRSIVPVGVSSTWRIILKKRWDRYTIPFPFTRSVITFGDPIHVPEDADNRLIESFRENVEKKLLKLNRQAEENPNRQLQVPEV